MRQMPLKQRGNKSFIQALDSRIAQKLITIVNVFFYSRVSGIGDQETAPKMKLWVKHARQVVRVVSNSEPFLAGPDQHNASLAILEECDGDALSILINR